MRLFLTRHSVKRMAERAINKEQVKEAIKKGSKIQQTNGLLAVYGYIEIAYKKIGRDCYKIKTVKLR
ncbi:DUF4258 domain-containing protein [Candidatus Woesearchaeota archaeon]|nr:DUF4258 domain-containing protein [Candidatus Woesearchaeota archaeon]